MNKNYFLTVVLSLLVFIPFGMLQAQAQQSMSPTKIITPTHFDVSQNLRDVEPIPPGYRTRSWKDNLIKNEEGFLNEFSRPSVMTGPDPVLQDAINSSRETNINVGQNFAGVNNKNGVAPPDTDGDVGPNHYFQMVNLSYAVWDKNGNQLLAPADNQTIWEGFDDGQPYDNANDGDPIVLYDSHADRWLVSQFAFNTSNNKFYELVAISTTAPEFISKQPSLIIKKSHLRLSVSQVSSTALNKVLVTLMSNSPKSVVESPPILIKSAPFNSQLIYLS